MSVSVYFTVLGTPAPQGSKVRTQYGMREDNPRTKPWRQAVAAEALGAMHDALLTGPVIVHADLYFQRPKAHYLTGGLRENAPVWHTTKPDMDKLQRALGDAMTGIVFRDDSQICQWHVRKMYGEPARAEIMVNPA